MSRKSSPDTSSGSRFNYDYEYDDANLEGRFSRIAKGDPPKWRLQQGMANNTEDPRVGQREASAGTTFECPAQTSHLRPRPVRCCATLREDCQNQSHEPTNMPQAGPPGTT